METIHVNPSVEIRLCKINPVLTEWVLVQQRTFSSIPHSGELNVKFLLHRLTTRDCAIFLFSFKFVQTFAFEFAQTRRQFVSNDICLYPVHFCLSYRQPNILFLSKHAVILTVSNICCLYFYYPRQFIIINKTSIDRYGRW